MRRGFARACLIVCTLAIATSANAARPYLLFESDPVQPVALTSDGSKLLVTNLPDNRLEVFDVDAVSGELVHVASVPVGMEPVSVVAVTNDEAWVANQVSDSVSIVSLADPPRVTRTLHVGDEPRGMAVAGSSHKRVFIATARRGQNSPNGGRHNRIPGQENDPDASAWDTPGIGRNDLWVFDSTNLGTELGGTPIEVITVFGDKGRAVTASPDGSKVYVAVYRSGNQTTVLNQAMLCGTSSANLASDAVQPACTLPSGQPSAGGYPPPHQNAPNTTDPAAGFQDRPEVGLIVKLNRDGSSPGVWQDEIPGRDWTDLVKFSLPDLDVFEIDADALVPAAVNGSSSCTTGNGCWSGVGTNLFNMVVHPNSGKIFVSNTDAENHVRFEGNGTYANGKKPAGEPDTVQGNLARSQITVLDGSTVTKRHLNPHINYNVRPAPPGTADASLASPLGMVIDVKDPTDPGDDVLYVAAFSSQKVGIFNVSELELGTFTPSPASHIELAGGGPDGLVLGNGFLYVHTRFDNAIYVHDTNSANAQIQKIALHDVEDATITDGRKMLYDARHTSSNGEQSCHSCHLFGDMDDLAWDLGNPDGEVVDNNNPFHFPPGPFILPQTFHPTKGPMGTQSLFGLANMGPQHWRGDRQGNATQAFTAFNEAFPGLLGRVDELTEADMDAFTNFALQLRYSPNPIAKLDGTRRPEEDLGMQIFTATGLHAGRITDTVETCVGCHALDPSAGHFGGDGDSVFDGGTQHFKTPHLRNQYQKVGMFGFANPATGSVGGAFEGDTSPFLNKGPQIRGFGFNHDGSVDTIFRFLSSSLFSVTAPEQTQLVSAMVTFPTDLPPIVGQQVTLTPSNFSDPAIASRVDLLEQRAAAPFVSQILGGAVTECDVVAQVVEGGELRGYLYQPASNDYKPDDGGAALPSASLRALAATAGQEVTYTCAPSGSGTRMALDRDNDLLINGVETGTGTFSSSTDTGSDPASNDTDGDGHFDGFEVFVLGSDPNDPNDPGSPGVPALTLWGLGSFVGLLLAAGIAISRVRQRPRVS